MLRAFLERPEVDGRRPHLVQSDGELLPFADATFDAACSSRFLAGLRGWRRLIAEARRVLKPAGALVVGRAAAPGDGVDATMKQRLASILTDMGVEPERTNVRGGRAALARRGRQGEHRAGRGRVERRAHAARLLERHAPARDFSALPAPVKDDALSQLGAFAAATFGSLDAVLREAHRFELKIYRFHEGAGR